MFHSSNQYGYAAIATPDCAYIAARSAFNASKQSLTTNIENTITLSTEVYDTGGFASLAGNQVTLQAGNYMFEAFVSLASDPTQNSFSSGFYVYDVTNSKVIATGIAHGSLEAASKTYVVNGYLQANAQTILELRVVYGGTATDVKVTRAFTTPTLATAGLDDRAGITIRRAKDNFNTGTMFVGGGGGGYTSYGEWAWVPANPSVAGQSITSDTVTTLTIDTEIQDNDNIGSVAANKVTLGAGTYYFEANTSVRNSDSSRTCSILGLYKTTAPAKYITNGGTVGSNGDSGRVSISLSGLFTIDGPTDFELRLLAKSASGAITVENGDATQVFSNTTAGADQRTTLKVWKK